MVVVQNGIVMVTEDSILDLPVIDETTQYINDERIYGLDHALI